MKSLNLFVLALALTSPIHNKAAAQTKLDGHSSKSLEQTQRLLRDKQEREAYIDNNSAAMRADSKADKVIQTPEQKQKMYEISAEVMDSLVKSNGGDVDKMNKVLMKAMKDPEGFMKSLPQEQQDSIRKLASEAESPPGKPRP